MEKYFFNTMQSGTEDNWLAYGYTEDLSEDEVKNKKVVEGKDEYDVVFLSEVPKYLEEHPKCRLYKAMVECLDEESKNFLLKNVKNFSYFDDLIIDWDKLMTYNLIWGKRNVV